MVKSTENFVFKNGSCSVDKKNQLLLKLKFIAVDTTVYGWIYPEPNK